MQGIHTCIGLTYDDVTQTALVAGGTYGASAYRRNLLVNIILPLTVKLHPRHHVTLAAVTTAVLGHPCYDIRGQSRAGRHNQKLDSVNVNDKNNFL